MKKYEVWVQSGKDGPWALHVQDLSLELAEKIAEVMEKDGWGFEIVSSKDKSLVRTNIP